MRILGSPAALAGAMLLTALAAPASGAEPYPVEFKFVNNQKNNDMKGVVHRLAGWVHVPRNDSRSIHNKFGSGNGEALYYYDVTVTENREGGEIYCSYQIEIKQQRTYHNEEKSYCSIANSYASSTRTCLGEIHHESAAGACEFTFTAGDPG
ncbi:hypothetical protein STVA_37120 [Allostella vacuolata]|nr:hypothetical protein STVA_37120 [Stella vacuolata]